MSQQAPQQEDGYYPRLNGSMLSSGQYNGMIVSLICSVLTFNGATQGLMVKCVDGNTARVVLDGAGGEFDHGPNAKIEIVGFVNDDATVNLFVTRDMGEDFDFEIYNRMISEVQANPKFAEYFVPTGNFGGGSIRTN